MCRVWQTRWQPSGTAVIALVLRHTGYVQSTNREALTHAGMGARGSSSGSQGVLQRAPFTSPQVGVHMQQSTDETNKHSF